MSQQIFKSPISQAQSMTEPYLDFDENQINEILKKAKTDFPNDWTDAIDYVRQELNTDWDEGITDVYPKKGYLYGLQSRQRGEPREVRLYRLKRGI